MNDIKYEKCISIFDMPILIKMFNDWMNYSNHNRYYNFIKR